MSTSYETISTQHKNNLRNLEGPFSIEGLKISQATRKNLERIASGQASYQQVLQEILAKYKKKG